VNQQRSNQVIGALLIDLRSRRSLSRYKLAQRAGMSAGHLYRIEHGRARLTPQMAHRIAKGLDMEPTRLVELVNEPGFVGFTASAVDHMLSSTTTRLAVSTRRQALLDHARQLNATDADLVWLLRHYDKDRS
jgi:transcriptional regulator with XRE-family HTH domain